MYKLINDDEGNLDGIFVLETKAMIPVDPYNYDYQDYLAWVCLLYTSPSPRDLSTSRMPSSA